MVFRKKALRFWMECFSQIDSDAGAWEGYRLARLASTEEEKTQALLGIARARYEESKIVRMDDIFNVDLKSMLEGKDLLEIGSNHGGGALCYYESYRLNSITGIDTTERQAEVSELFFKEMGATSNFRFQKALAEELPFPPESFDAVMCYDVIEHVTDVVRTLDEMYRVLRPGGRAFISFPSFYHPTQHHLSIVTRAPFIHWFFSAETLMELYYDILDRNPEYRDQKGQARRQLEPWERLHIINGTTLRQFRHMIKKQQWKNRIHVRLPLGSHSRLFRRMRFLRPLRYVFLLGTKIPVLDEVCNHRVVFILEK
jgi:ubiquinone/menaquinone biosynthesis C-methylase UbiE